MGGLRLEAIGLGTLVRGTGVHDGLCIVPGSKGRVSGRAGLAVERERRW